MTSVLFVCLGNICRSPLAEAAFRSVAEAAGFEVHVDSAGTGDWHVGDPPDPRACAVALKNGIDIRAYRGRQVSSADFLRFTHIIALDRKNLSDLEQLAPQDRTATLSLLLDHVPGRAGEGVIDPYYGDQDGFDATWQDVLTGAQALLARLQASG